jgi:hypothetical protein
MNKARNSGPYSLAQKTVRYSVKRIPCFETVAATTGSLSSHLRRRKYISRSKVDSFRRVAVSRCAVPVRTTMRYVCDALFRARTLEMKPVAMLISLFFFAQLGGCAYAQTSGCKQPENRGDCLREANEPNKAKQQLKDKQQLKQEQDDRSPVRRRAAPSIIQRAQPVPPMTIRREQSVPQAPAPARPTTPLPAGSCDAGGCWDNNANRYNGGAAGTYLDNSGKPCHRVGSWIQCF